MKVKILGISGSPRHGNTDILVKETLKSAESLGDVETEFIAIADYKIRSGCISCYKCKGTDYEELCRGVKDDVNTIFKKMLEADGWILGNPVYFGGITAQLKSIFDRSMSVEYAGFGFRNKVAGVVTAAVDRQGGHEGTIMDIHRFCMIHDMIVMGSGPERPPHGIGCYWGAAALRGFPYPVSSSDPKAITAVSQDTIGLETCRYLGLRVAEMTQVVKAGFSSEDVKTHWPYQGR
jgi:multimeric flavodoxin WrbA